MNFATNNAEVTVIKKDKEYLIKTNMILRWYGGDLPDVKIYYPNY